MQIYKITNIINDKVYIGQTTLALKKRWSGHCCPSALKNNMLITKAILKYGKENFRIETLEICKTLEDLNLREIYWISFYNSLNKKIGYNTKPGGKFSTHSDETKQKIKEKLALSEKFKNKKVWNKGLTIATSNKLKIIGKSKQGQKRNLLTKLKMSNAKKGKSAKDIFKNLNKLKGTASKYGKDILLLDEDKNILQSFETILDALRFLKIKRNNGAVAKAIKNNKKYKNFYWEYKC